MILVQFKVKNYFAGSQWQPGIPQAYVKYNYDLVTDAIRSGPAVVVHWTVRLFIAAPLTSPVIVDAVSFVYKTE